MSQHNKDLTQKKTKSTTTDSNSIIIYLIALGAFSLGIASYVTAGLIPMFELDFNISTGIAAQLVTVFTLAYGIGSPIVIAFLPADKQRHGLLLALVLFVLSSAASTVSGNFATLLGFRALAGISSGVYLAIGITTVASLATASRGKAIAVIMGGMASGTVLGVPCSLILAEKLGWQSAFWLVTLLGGVALIGLLYWLPALPNVKKIPLKQKVSLLFDKQVTTILFVSLLAAISSLGMYTFLATLISSPEYGDVSSIAPYLWVWGIGGIIGSFLVGPLSEHITAPLITLYIMGLLALSLLFLPIIAYYSIGLVFIPIIIWGAVGWALQVPQNNLLINTRESRGDENLAVALNESALYLGSAIGAVVGGIALLLALPIWSLPIGAGIVATIGALVQFINMRRNT